jgi:hypothetical protein
MGPASRAVMVYQDSLGVSIECHCISNGCSTVSLFFFIAPWRTDALRGFF